MFGPFINFPSIKNISECDKKPEVAFMLGCMLILVILFLNLFIGGICSYHSMDYYFDIHMPWYGHAAIGLIAGEVLVPASVVGLVLEHCGGVEKPVFKNTKSRNKKTDE